MCPSAESGRIGRARRILAMRRCLLHGISCGDVLTGLLAAPQAEGRRRRQPIGQDREGLVARLTDSAPYPNAFVPVVVGGAGPQSMADDRVVSAKGTAPRQEFQRGHPRVDVVFRRRQCDKENHGWREGPPLTVPCERFDLLAGPSPSGKVSANEKKNTASHCPPRSPQLAHWPVIVGFSSIGPKRRGRGACRITPDVSRSRKSRSVS